MHFNRELTDHSLSFIPENATKKHCVLSRYSGGCSKWYSTVPSQTHQLYLANYVENMANYGEFDGVNYVGAVISTNNRTKWLLNHGLIPA